VTKPLPNQCPSTAVVSKFVKGIINSTLPPREEEEKMMAVRRKALASETDARRTGTSGGLERERK